MATQRFTIATVAGKSAAVIADGVKLWQAQPNADQIDNLCDSIRCHANFLPVVYFSEWVDRWSMHYLMPSVDTVDGGRYKLSCLSPDQAQQWAEQCGEQDQETQWFAARLREAADAWTPLVDRRTILIIREVVGPSTLDDEVREALDKLPGWLAPEGTLLNRGG